MGTPQPVSHSGRQETFISAGGTTADRLFTGEDKDLYGTKNLYGLSQADGKYLDNTKIIGPQVTTICNPSSTPTVHVASNVTSSLWADGQSVDDESDDDGDANSANQPLLLPDPH